MQIAKMVIAVLFMYLVFTQMPFAATAQTESDKQASGGLSFLHTDGQKIVDDNRKAVHLHGVNIGGWLLIEPWIIDAEGQEGIVAEKDIWDFKGRKEPSTVESQELRQTFRDNWFTEDDVKKIAAAGLNSVRLPIWWRAINNSDEEYGGGLEYIDNCIEWCNNSSLYVILDLHGAPGGQNKIGKNTGEQTNADLWKNEAFMNQTVDFWRTIAERYKNESTVAGYDILNEAVPDDGNLSTEDDFEVMINLSDRIYDAIRDVEKDQEHKHIIVLEAGMFSHNLSLMPHPKDNAWENVAYSFHYHLTNCIDPNEVESVIFPRLQAMAMQYDVPIYVGEFNTMQIGVRCDKPYENLNISQRLQLLETYRSIFDYYNWSWAFWTYKTIDRNRSNTWGLYVNDTPAPDFNKDPYEDINDSFSSMRTEEKDKKCSLVKALTNTSCWEFSKEQIWDGADLTMQNALLLRPGNSGLIVEWNCPLPNAGNWSEGDSISWKFNVNATDLYEVTLYSSSNKSTGNIVAVWIDGVLAAEIPIEFSGGWDRYVNNSLGKYNLDAGDHTLAISQSRNDNAKDFLNLRSVSLRRSSGHASSIIGREIDLNAANFASIQPNSTLIRIDWQAKPWTFGYWNQTGKVVWDTHLDQSADQPATYDINIEYATPNNETTLIVGIDGKEHPGYKLDGTVDWANYRWYNDTISIQEIKDNISVMWKPGVGTGDVGNLRRIHFVRRPDHIRIIPTSPFADAAT